MFIEIEGIDGVGKTTQCDLLLKWFRIQGFPAMIVKEPGGTLFGRKLKELIMSDTPRNKKTELFSFLAAKSQLYTEIILPALQSGTWVIADRGGLSFLSYHHISAGVEIDELRRLLSAATEATVPDLTIMLDAPPETALQRMLDSGRDLTSFDLKGNGFFADQRRIFKQLCGTLPHCTVIDALPGIAEINEQVRARVAAVVR
jgi:dTMP kinase